MAGQSKKTRDKIDRRTRQLRDGLWPDAPARIWEYEKSDGWLNIPRAMPVIMRIMDSLTKGQPVSSTYFELWCRTYNNGFVTASRPREMAFFSGFDGERAQRTWAARIASLRQLGFIDVKEGPSGPISYILIENPYTPLKALHKQGMISEQFWNALMARMIEIGADDMDELPPEAAGQSKDELEKKEPEAAAT
ncbi:MAG: hypothetical protein H0T41_10390 [Rhodobacteraceae bacterium]|nr:hypothetical protein [Paracoccaceae bacterium]